MRYEEFLSSELDVLAKFSGVLVGDRQAAHDVLADALMIVARRWDSIGRMERPAAYARRVIVTTYLADRRKWARRRTSPAEHPYSVDPGTEDGTARVDDRQFLQTLLKALPPQQRAAVVLRYYLDYDDSAIAVVMGTTVGGVRSNVSRALASLRLTPEVLDLRKGTTP